MYKLQFDESKWKVANYKPSNTVQMFITNQCNKQCAGCFYQNYINNNEMALEDYDAILTNIFNIEKVVLIGGEPTLHNDIAGFIKYNQVFGYKTTVYTNGYNLKSLENIDLTDVTIRVGVLGLHESEKPLAELT